MSEPQESEVPVEQNENEPQSEEVPAPAESLSDTDEEDSGRQSKELLTESKVSDLMGDDPLASVVTGIFEQLVANVNLGKTAAKDNQDSYSAALKEFKEQNSEAYNSWDSEYQDMDSALTVLQDKIKAHRAILENEVEKYRTASPVDLGSVNERHRKLKISLFNFLTTAGVSDADTTYRVPELPAQAKISTGWAPRLSRATVNDKPVPHTGDNVTLTDVNKAIGIKGDPGSGASWADRFGTRDIGVSGLSTTLTFNGKSYRVHIWGR